MNYQYTEDELQNFDKLLLSKIAEDYNLKINKNAEKSNIIEQILKYQKHLSNFNNLPGDVLRLLGLYMNTCDIIHLCRLNKKINNNVCKNRIFSKELGHLRLTAVNERLIGKNILKDINNTDLNYAAKSGYLQQIKYLVSHGFLQGKKSGVNIGKDYKNMIDIAAKKGYIDVLKYLIFEQTYYQPKRVTVVIDRALQSAVGANQLEVVKYLVSEGADVDEGEGEALMLAAGRGHLDMIKYLLSLGVDIHRGDGVALISAAYGGRLNVVKYLVENGADVHADEDGALRFAAKGGHLNVVKYLISQGADMHERDDGALAMASQNGHLDIVKYLISQGADIHAENDHALRLAAKAGRLEVARHLISQGANTDVIDKTTLGRIRFVAPIELYKCLESVESEK